MTRVHPWAREHASGPSLGARSAPAAPRDRDRHDVRLGTRRLQGEARVAEVRQRLDRLMARLLALWQRLRDDPHAWAELMDQTRMDEAATIDASALSERPERSAATPPPAKRPASNDLAAAPPARPPEQVAEFARVALEIRARFTQAASDIAGASQEGLTVVDAQTLRTERYEIRFERADALRITDLTTGQFTRVWGDPHVDLSTVAGELNGEFADLKASRYVTTFVLADGTRVRFQAPDDGLIESVDVVRGRARVHGTGVAAGGQAIGLFHDVASAASAPIDLGDVVHAGSDGATWYDASGRVVWGRSEVRYDAATIRKDLSYVEHVSN